MTLPARPPAVSVELLRMCYGRKVALHDVSFRIPEGTICGLIGPNGAGKTSALRILATDLVPTAGTVHLFGRDVATDYAVLRPRLGFMTDTPELFEDMNLEGYLAMFASLYGLSGADGRGAVGAAIEMVGLHASRRRRLHNLSKGEAQRVALARTLLHSPELLILDEPADGLDPQGRIELRELLRLLREQGRTILVSSHILTDLEAICDRLVLLRQGRVAFAGDREELEARTAHEELVTVELARGSAPPLADALAGIPGVGIVQEHPGGAELQIAGGRDRAADVLAILLRNGLRVSSFHRRRATLEDLFLRLVAPADET